MECQIENYINTDIGPTKNKQIHCSYLVPPLSQVVWLLDKRKKDALVQYNVQCAI